MVEGLLKRPARLEAHEDGRRGKLERHEAQHPEGEAPRVEERPMRRYRQVCSRRDPRAGLQGENDPRAGLQGENDPRAGLQGENDPRDRAQEEVRNTDAGRQQHRRWP
jgi:hypothetical protein